MTGWLVFASIALLSGVGLWIARYPLRLWTVPATALMLAAAGYAWQGNPALPGKPVAAKAQAGEVDPEMVALRESLFGRFNLEFAYFTAADAMTRAGSPRQAAWVMVGAVRKLPENAAMWTGLGEKLAENDGNQVSPASKYAFERALALAPGHPGPRFFYGLSLIKEGKFAEARPLWSEAVELAPAGASYRGQLLVRLMLLDRFIQAQEAQQRGQAAPAAR
jgi:cytochrome c-type biogenesis protein CcmH